jgi:uncharacterized membrane protein YhaH (DUF805 family)
VASVRTPASPLIWLFFSPKGRISRGVYWLSYVFLICINSVLIGQVVGGEEASFHGVAVAASPFVAFGSLYANVSFLVKRLHDFNTSGAFAAVLLLPLFAGIFMMATGSFALAPIASLVNLAVVIWAGVVAGTPGPNRYGEAPDRVPA